MKFVVLITFVCLALAVNGLEKETKELITEILEVKALSVQQQNEITAQLKQIYNNNPTNKIRAEKLALVLEELGYCAVPNDGWNVIILDDSWYDRHTFHITSDTVHYLAVKVKGLWVKEQIFVVFNEC